MLDMGNLKDLGEIIAELRKTVDDLISIPSRLVDEVGKVVWNFRGLRGKLRVANEIAAIRDILESFSRLYIRKGDLLAYLDELSSENIDEYGDIVRSITKDMHYHVVRVRISLSGNHISNISLVRDTTMIISRAKMLYKKIYKSDNQKLLTQKDGAVARAGRRRLTSPVQGHL